MQSNDVLIPQAQAHGNGMDSAVVRFDPISSSFKVSLRLSQHDKSNAWYSRDDERHTKATHRSEARRLATILTSVPPHQISNEIIVQSLGL
jgi:hypothetical protein